MLSRKLSLTILVAGFGCLLLTNIYFQTGNAMQSKDREKEQILHGRDVYLRYCASCHGADAKGRGAVSIALRKRPADLTRINARYGRFPTAKIRGIIIGEARLPVHGAREMPVWGAILRDPDLANLLKYLESIQRSAESVPAKLSVE